MSELIERVARKLDPAAWWLIDDYLNRPEGTALHMAGVRYRKMSLTKARIAIAAVAEWLDTQGDEQWYPGERLREQLEQAKND